MDIGVFAKKLRIWIDFKYGSIQSFANEVGLKYATVHHYLSGRSEPGLEFLFKIKERGCDLDWLLTDDDRPPPNTTDKAQQLKDLEEENKRLRGSIGTIGLLAEIIEKGKHQLIEDAVDRAIKKALK